jgi:hypothetical protein
LGCSAVGRDHHFRQYPFPKYQCTLPALFLLGWVVIVDQPAELTTSATDAVLAIECAVVLAILWRTPTGDRWRIGLWCWAFGLLAVASSLGAVAHGFEMPQTLRAALWKPLYLSLGLVLGLFLVGACFDWQGPAFARRLVPWSIGLGGVFFGVTQLLDGAFIVFVVYEAAAMTSAFAIYIFLAATQRLRGAGVVAAAIFLNLAAAATQASSVSFKIAVPFDHNGVFHLVQMVAIATLGLGLRLGMGLGAERVSSDLAH